MPLDLFPRVSTVRGSAAQGADGNSQKGASSRNRSRVLPPPCLGGEPGGSGCSAWEWVSEITRYIRTLNFGEMTLSFAQKSCLKLVAYKQQFMQICRYINNLSLHLNSHTCLQWFISYHHQTDSYKEISPCCYIAFYKEITWTGVYTFFIKDLLPHIIANP